MDKSKLATQAIHDKTSIRTAIRQSFGSVVYTINEYSELEFFQPIVAGKWSPGEHVGHLILSTMAVTKGMTMPKEALEGTFGTKEDVESSFDELKDRYYRILSKGVKAPGNFVYNKPEERGKNYLLSKFVNQMRILLDSLDEWNEKQLSHYVLPHPALGRLSIREMLFFTHFHTEHHRVQIVTDQTN